MIETERECCQCRLLGEHQRQSGKLDMDYPCSCIKDIAMYFAVMTRRQMRLEWRPPAENGSCIGDLRTQECLAYFGDIFSQGSAVSELMIMNEVTWSYLVFILACVPWIVYCFVITFFTVSLWYSRFRLNKVKNPCVEMDELPAVSIVKPLMGIDPFLESNLESHFSMTYPKFELLICVQDENDPAINIVNKMREKYRKTNCRVFIGGKDGIINPMVHNMAPAYDAASYQVVWISTSRIQASTEILMDMIARLKPRDVALVHQMPFTTDQRGLAAAIEKVYFGTQIARYYLAFHALGIPCFTGMSYLVKKDELDKLQGLSWFGRFIAEDFFISKLLHERGFRHQVAGVPAQQNVSSCSIATYKDRMVRWLRLRMNMLPFLGGLLEPLAESVPLGVYAAWSAYYLFGVNPYLWFLGHWAVWCSLDFINLKQVQNGPLPFSVFTYLLSWVIRELLFVYIYFEALLGVRYIKWGKRTYRLSNFGRALDVVSDKNLLTI